MNRRIVGSSWQSSNTKDSALDKLSVVSQSFTQPSLQDFTNIAFANITIEADSRIAPILNPTQRKESIKRVKTANNTPERKNTRFQGVNKVIEHIKKSTQPFQGLGITKDRGCRSSLSASRVKEEQSTTAHHSIRSLSAQQSFQQPQHELLQVTAGISVRGRCKGVGQGKGYLSKIGDSLKVSRNSFKQQKAVNTELNQVDHPISEKISWISSAGTTCPSKISGAEKDLPYALVNKNFQVVQKEKNLTHALKQKLGKAIISEEKKDPLGFLQKTQEVATPSVPFQAVSKSFEVSQIQGSTSLQPKGITHFLSKSLSQRKPCSVTPLSQKIAETSQNEYNKQRSNTTSILYRNQGDLQTNERPLSSKKVSKGLVSTQKYNLKQRKSEGSSFEQFKNLNIGQEKKSSFQSIGLSQSTRMQQIQRFSGLMYRNEQRSLDSQSTERHQIQKVSSALGNKLSTSQSLSVTSHIPYPIIPPMVVVASSRTRKGVMASNPKKVNQDSMFLCSGIKDDRFSTSILLGVMDGHGSHGHIVSQFIKQNFEHEFLLNSEPDYVKRLAQVIAILNMKLGYSGIDCSLSGTTMVSLLLLFQENTLRIVSCNCGDSRAIMGLLKCITNDSEQKNTYLFEVLELTRDHKPELPDETQRILSANGRIDSYRDEQGNQLGPMRVWLQHENSPGIAMSRSLGDDIATSVGVTWVPEIKEFNIKFNQPNIASVYHSEETVSAANDVQWITAERGFLVIGSDGVWEFLPNEDVVREVGRYYVLNNIEGACDWLVAEAYRQWTSEDDSVVDDITFIIIFLAHPQRGGGFQNASRSLSKPKHLQKQ